ncbi:HCPE-like protein [Mya arenaria]|uniref:HCPE-like protein n=1 Tax=Mya arenaria TaxID=6604 RepID=A0ABY7FQ75_MYAAR|nr:HCPE-like protein [Mya arenaria]
MIDPNTDAEVLEHYYKKFENNNKFNCFEKKDQEDFYLKNERIPEAKAAFKINCFENSYGPSCHRFANLLYDEGLVERDDFIKALQFGCNGKNFSSDACALLGMLHDPRPGQLFQKGVFLEDNMKKAVEYYEKGCNGGAPQGCHNLANMYNRQGNSEKALLFMEKTCELGDRKACIFVYNVYAGMSKHFPDIKPNKIKEEYYKKIVIDSSSG